MRFGGQTAILATVTVLLCMVAVLTGFAFMKLSENGEQSPTYTVSDVTKDGEPIHYSGSVTCESFNESTQGSIYRFSFDLDIEGRTYSHQVTVIIDNSNCEPFDYVWSDGVWVNSDGTVLNVSDSGYISWIEIHMDGLIVKAHRNP